jgi:hypothetical protein
MSIIHIAGTETPTGRHPFVFLTFFHTAKHELAVPIARHKLVSRTLGPSCAIFVVRIQSITVKQKTVSKQCR